MPVRQPPALLADPQFFLLSRGTILHRVHQSDLGATEFNPGIGHPTRFGPFCDGAGEIVPVLYACSTARAAIHETIFHDIPARVVKKRVRLATVHARDHSEIEAVRDLRLVELRTPTLSRWGVSRNDLISSSPACFRHTALWAKAVHRDVPDADGLVWTSNQCDPDDAFLIFGDRAGETAFAIRGMRDGMTDKSFWWDVRNEGQLRGIKLVT